MIERFLTNSILNSIKPGHVVGLLGARRVGKTILMEQIKSRLDGRKVLIIQGDNLDVAEIISSRRKSVIERLVKEYEFLFIDEAQMIPGIGASLKLMVDTLPGLSIFVTGSSAFDIKNSTGEPLTGRSTFFNLFPFAQLEMNEDFLQTRENLESKLIYGTYPQVHFSPNEDEKKATLYGIRDGYLLKDLLAMDNLKNSVFVINLLRMIAHQIGNEISYSELGRALNADNKTIKRYLELLEKMFVLFSLNGFSQNIRKEYTKSPRYYFWDNGIRNAVISNFNPLVMRDDIGKLWENYCISERLKKVHYTRIFANSYFWRTYDQQEIDYIEEKDSQITGYEIKWKDEKARSKKTFESTYANAKVEIINRDNFLDFIS